MRKIYTYMVNHRISIIIIFLFSSILCAIASGFVSVNYEMNDYLPENTHSTVSLEIMQEEFNQAIPNARVMVKNVTIPEALEYKEQLSKVSGVISVTWLNDAVDITLPLATLDADTIESYYKDNTALYSVTIDEEYLIEATDAIEKIIGEDNAMTGNAVSTAAATTNTVVEIKKITVIAVIFVLLVLILTTSTWIEPVLVLAGLGVAIIINSGSNLIFGEISFVTNAAGSILQLAVSLDYSVFLIHRFEECRKENPDVKDAMVEALCKSTSSILSSGFTTVIGFLALVLMQFKIGPDLGLALAKGVAISLITVFIFMPALILTKYRLMDKTKHKSFLPSFKKFGHFVCHLCFPMVGIFILVMLPAFLASNSNSYYYGSSHIFGEGTKLGADTEEIENIFGKSDSYVLMVPRGDTATEKELSKELKKLSNITGIISYVDLVGAEIPTEYLDSDTLSQLMSDNYSRMVINVSVPYEGEETFSLVASIRELAELYYPDSYYLAGGGVSTYDLMSTITSDMVKVNFLAIGAVFVVLLITMKSLILPVILVLNIETAIWINLAIPYFTGSPIFYIAYLIISSIQLGATVDYAILMTDRYRENRENLPKKEALIQTICDVTVSIITSGSVLTAVGLLLGFISSNGILSQLGIFVGRGAIFSLLIVLFVLPGLLFIFDKLLIKKDRNNAIQEV